MILSKLWHKKYKKKINRYWKESHVVLERIPHNMSILSVLDSRSKLKYIEYMYAIVLSEIVTKMKCKEITNLL